MWLYWFGMTLGREKVVVALGLRARDVVCLFEAE